MAPPVSKKLKEAEKFATFAYVEIKIAEHIGSEDDTHLS